MFKKGDIVKYGTNGIFEISDISTVDIPGIDKDRLYYILKQQNGGTTIYAATDGDNSKIRHLMTKDEALELVSKISDTEPLELKDSKKPELEYKTAIQKHDCKELIKLIKCIYYRIQQRREEGKKPTSIDEKYIHLAEAVLYQEMGTVLDIPEDKVLDYIFSKIEKKNK